MAKTKEWTKTMRGGQLIAAGDIINMAEGDGLLKCRVLSCLAVEDGSCLAGLEILEGERRGERITTKLRAGPPSEG
jgi:hypothetical protein